MTAALRIIAFRLLQAAGVALVVGVMSFLMMQAMPGDMAYRIAAARYGYDLASAELAQAVRVELGLGADPLAQFLRWMSDLAQFDLGKSLVSGQSVWGEIVHQLGASLELAAMALALSLLIGPPLGIYAGLNAGGRFDGALLVIAAAFRAVPQFLLGLVLIVIFAVQFRLLPSAGYGQASHFFLPAGTLALGLAAASARITRDAMAAVEASPHYAFARTKGLSEIQVLLRHGLRNIGAPVITYLGLQFVLLAEGVVVVETIFGWPGIGHALIHAVFHRDVPMVQGTALVMGLTFVVINAVIDLVARRIDPREVRA
ncbi:ABC transporter permease [Rhizobium sp. BK068]|uniref:ABC transporter permease n=1 Tax=unclassified Rhizobium TaxID=2613769 RepID=UPI0010EEAD28|nr:ABC transporter permease [Rhizobium sp. BK068]MBB3399346.1 peptide/nickel transport system permease protein [Rhizobium sp. BK060]MBB4166627.1 peptide/nickel transport system permease protein [Rhizobium sp. BK538]TCM67625.1 peptide/nickel transport system permease protein [Rhizobium sp. BK068]